jgi:glycosyltransferase involved in cell wall biosynthesis
VTVGRSALLAVQTDVTHDPRVRRQIDWLTSDGWTVDTLGYGEHPAPEVREHFRVAPPRRWQKTYLGAALAHLFVPYRARFRLLTQSRFPPEISSKVAAGEYDLVLLNDYHFVPWLDDRAAFPRDRRVAHVHIDLHEYFPRDLPKIVTGWQLMRPYHRWMRRFIADDLVDTRSVAGATAELYAEEFGFEVPPLVRNMPPREDLEPSAVDPDRIELIYHGLGSWVRGLREMVDAMREVDRRFVLTFMLTGAESAMDELPAYIADQSDRIRLVPPVPMRELARAINSYDVAVMFFPPRTQNLVHTLPNKLFEAIQGRLAIVTGPTKLIGETVAQFGNGVVTAGWEPSDLAAAINGLTPETITELKQASHRAAATANAEAERAVFLRSIGHPAG